MAEKSPTEILRKEHETVLALLDRLEDALEKKDSASAAKTLAQVQKEFEKHSLNKEEKVLFPAIEKFIPRDGGPTGVMISEHENLVESIGAFRKAAAVKDMQTMAERGMHIIHLLREHIGKEDQILFMIADMHLDSGQKKGILKKFAQIDAKK